MTGQQEPDRHDVSVISIAIDATEDADGRALGLVSVLNLAAPALVDCRIVPLGTVTPDVDIALEALAYDTGLDVASAGPTDRPGTRASWTRHQLYLSMRRARLDLWKLLLARAAGVGLLLAVERPRLISGPFPILPDLYCYDTAAFAALLRGCVDHLRNHGRLRQTEIGRLALRLAPERADGADIGRTAP